MPCPCQEVRALAEEEQNKGAEKQCFLCSATSHKAPLLACEHQGQAKWVCVRCLPVLIHGVH